MNAPRALQAHCYTGALAEDGSRASRVP